MTEATAALGAERLAEFVRSLGAEFVVYSNADGDYDHIGATIADAILQANRDYYKIVRPRVAAILKRYPRCRTTAALNELLQEVSIGEFLGYDSLQRQQRFADVLRLFNEERIDNIEDLRGWLLKAENLAKLRKIRGIGPKTADYFKMLVGLQTAAIDRRLEEFLRRAEVAYSGYEEALGIINRCADLLNISRSHFDHSIWRYVGNNPRHGRACPGHPRNLH